MSIIRPSRRQLRCKIPLLCGFSSVGHKIKSVGIVVVCWVMSAAHFLPDGHVQLWEKGVGVWGRSVDFGGVNSVNLWHAQCIAVYLCTADDNARALDKFTAVRTPLTPVGREEMTMFSRSGSGRRPIDSKVFRPMMTSPPLVSRLKCARSAGKLRPHGKSPPRPMARLVS